MRQAPQHDPSQPYPNVRAALLLTLLAVLAAGFTGVAFLDFGLLAAVGIGQAIGVGAVATMGAQRVAEPQAKRLGLRGLDPEAIPVILCLIPAILLASELDNFAADWSPGPTSIAQSENDARERDVLAERSGGLYTESGRPDDGADAFDAYDRDDSIDAREVLPRDQLASGYDIESDGDETHVSVGTSSRRDDDGSGGARDGDEGGGRDADDPSGRPSDGANATEPPARLVDVDDPASVLSAIVVMVGISPIVEEFLFRGVIQQGLVQRMGLLRGVSVVALLWTLLRPAPLAGFARFLAATIASFALGWALGMVRIATRSILGPILLASGWAAVGLASLVFEGRLDLPGMNVPGTHLPELVTLASAILVGWAGRTVYREAERRFREEREDIKASGRTESAD